MSKTCVVLEVSGTVFEHGRHPLLVLDARVEGHDTFLQGHLEIEGRRLPVRIISLDGLTVLHPRSDKALLSFGDRWTGRLFLPVGISRGTPPPDLLEAAQAAGRSLEHLDEAELRYTLTFLGEASTASIRRGRIEAIVAALPSGRLQAT